MFSCASGREGRCRQMSLAMWGALAVFRPHWVCPAHGCVLSLSTLLRLQAALQGAGPELHALPRPKSLRFRVSGTPQRRRFGWACVLCLPCPSSSGDQELNERTLFRCSVTSPLPVPACFQARWSGAPCVSSGELISGCDLPGGCQPSRISGSLW